MAYPANLRGWDNGWPTNRSREMRWVRAARSGAKWQVHYDIAPIVQFVVDTIEARGYLFDHGPADVDDDWGYSNRPIRGTRTPSNHSWGLAIDIDAQRYPQGTRRRPPQWIIDLFEKYGFEWGGDWSFRDPMHFEWRGSRTEARHMVAMLAAGHLANVPAPLPSYTPPVSDTPIAKPPRAPEDEPVALVKGSGPAIYSTNWVTKTHLNPKLLQTIQFDLKARGLPAHVSTIDDQALGAIPTTAGSEDLMRTAKTIIDAR